MNNVAIDGALAAKAISEALAKFPQFAGFGARIVGRPLFQGAAYMLEYDRQPPAELPDAWEFQNAAVKGYRRLAGV